MLTMFLFLYFIFRVTREHREALAKNAKVICNDAKDKLRNIQNRFTKDVKKKNDVSGDLTFNVEHQVRF